jgi:hypothetical protein
MRRLLLGLFLLGAVGLSANDAVATPREIVVVAQCQSTNGYLVMAVRVGPANQRFVQEAITFVRSQPCEPGTFSVTVRPTKP